MVYKFPKRRRKAAEIDAINLFGDTLSDELEQPGLINGIQARSILEWRVAKALWKLGLDFRYQHSLFGGTSRRGGYVLDFLVESAPEWIPLEVQGERWHTGGFASDEMIREALIEAYLGTEIRYVWENQLQSDEEALQAVKTVLL